MRETCEFRVDEQFASLLFGPDEGVRLSSAVRKVLLDTHDPRFPEAGRLQRELRATRGSPFFYGWVIRRRYSRSELEAAKLFHLQITAMFEPAGEECGTVYDESVACPICGAGRRQVSDLVLDLRKTPKRADIARTIADEWIVSERLGTVFQKSGMTGIDLRPVRHKGFYEDDSIDLRKYPSGRELIEEAAAVGIDYPSGQFDVWLNQRDRWLLLDSAWREHATAMEAREARRVKPLPVWYQMIPDSTPVRLTENTVRYRPVQ